jgi:predicted O-methyltransferase YrrM
MSEEYLSQATQNFIKNTRSKSSDHDIIQAIVDACGYTSFLELGISTGNLCPRLRDNCPDLDLIVGVDNDPELFKDAKVMTSALSRNITYVNTTTDEFFANNNEQFDCIFVDAMHEYKQATRDFNNSLDVITPDGLIFLHDTYPPSIEHTDSSSSWDVYRTYLDIVEREDLEVINIPLHLGLCIVRPVDPNNRILPLKGHV